jgi:hypothetical protein
MKIVELVHYYYNQKSKMISVKFRIDGDKEDQVREFDFEMDEIYDMGYTVVEEKYNYESNDFPIMYDEDIDEVIFDDEKDEEEDFTVDENELMSFISEYFQKNTKKLPPTQFF